MDFRPQRVGTRSEKILFRPKIEIPWIFRLRRVDTRSRKSMKMGINGSAMNPHGLIFDEDGAISCPMPLDAFPTPFKVVLSPF